MQYSLPWQPGRQLLLELPTDALVCAFAGPQDPGAADVFSTACEALEHPLDFPALARAVVPGDQVVLAVEDDIPQAAAIVGAVISRLTAAGVQAADIRVLQPRPSVQASELGEVLPGPIAEQVQFTVHAPENSEELAFLTSTQDAMPVLLNRHLIEADLVVPIGRHRPPESPGYDGPAGTVCPTFSDRQTQKHFRGYHTTNSATRHLDRAHAKAEEISWLLGVQFVIRVIPGEQDHIAAVVAGSAAAASAAADKAYRETWQVKATRRASLVVATVTGDAREQTWENFGRAVEAAGEAVDTDGAIVICCDLNEPPGPCVQQLVHGEHPVAALSQIRRLREYDAVPAAQLARVLERAQVCLMGSLTKELVEDLGMVHVENSTEIARLAKAHASCMLITGAQFATVAIDEAAAASLGDS